MHVHFSLGCVPISDEEVAQCFDDWRRSSALILLASWRARELITDEEFAAFTPETRHLVGVILS